MLSLNADVWDQNVLQNIVTVFQMVNHVALYANVKVV
jgi:hypothetical protein